MTMNNLKLLSSLCEIEGLRVVSAAELAEELSGGTIWNEGLSWACPL